MNTIAVYTGTNGATYVPCRIDADGTARFLFGRQLPTGARVLQGRELADYLAGK